MAHDRFDTQKELRLASGATGRYYSLPALERAGIGKVSRLPVSIRIVLESVLRNCDGKKVTEQHVRQVANWSPNAPRTDEIPFVVARVVLQDFTGVPLLCDLAAMRNVAADLGRDPKLIEPLVPVDLVVDHSVMIDYYGSPDALELNMKLEFDRNAERYQFMKWGMQAFDTFKVVPPGIGIVHQVNLEYLAPGVHLKDGIYYPDTLVGTDSHTTMINGIGVVGWGVGGIEAEAGMLGQPVYFLTPDVVGVELTGRLPEGATATDLVLTVTEMLRKEKVVGKFVEFFGEGTATLSVPDRATIGNMAPEYGATMGFFPVDAATVDYLRATGRSDDALDAFETYFKAQGLFGMPRAGDIDYTKTLTLDLASVTSSVAGPKRPQDRIELPKLATRFAELFSKPGSENGFSQPAERLRERYKTLPMIAGRGAISDAEQQVPRNGMPRDYIEMVNNRPTVDRIAPPVPAARRHRQRRHPDRRDHLVHEHVEPERAARRRPACEEGSREGLDRQAAYQDVAGARVARGHRLPHEDEALAVSRAARLRRRRVRLHDLHRQRRRSDAGNQRCDREPRSRLRRGAVGQSQLRGAHSSEPQGQFPDVAAARRRVRDRRQRAARHRQRAARRRARRAGVPARHLAFVTGDRRAARLRTRSGHVPAPLWRSRQHESDVVRRSRARPGRFTTGRHRRTSRSRRSSTASA